MLDCDGRCLFHPRGAAAHHLRALEQRINPQQPGRTGGLQPRLSHHVQCLNGDPERLSRVYMLPLWPLVVINPLSSEPRISGG